MSRMGQPGIAAVPDKSQPGQVVLRLMRQPAEPAPSGSGHLPTLDAEDLDGRRVRNADLAGRHTLVTFYFATCVPCIKEVPALNTYRRAHPDLNYLAVTYESVAEARAFVAKHGLEWPVIADARPFLDAAGVRGFPTYLLVSPDGRILGRESGLPLDPKEEIPGLASLTAFVAAHLP
jgi:peroxiredoxin